MRSRVYSKLCYIYDEAKWQVTGESRYTGEETGSIYIQHGRGSCISKTGLDFRRVVSSFGCQACEHGRVRSVSFFLFHSKIPTFTTAA